MRTYDSYKNSGIEWIGEIPRHWLCVKPQFLFRPSNRNPHENDEIVTCFRDGVVTLRKNRREDGFTTSLKEIGYQRILVGDLVIHEMDGFEGSIGVSDSIGKSTPVYTVISESESHSNRYWMYLLREMSNTRFIQSLSKSIRERTTEFRWNMWKNQLFPLPPLSEQEQIVSYLDEKTSLIDEMVEKKKRKIELLKEYRTSLINTVVTKGLNTDVPMKDSGIEWIGEIPRHWDIIPLKVLGSFQNGISKGSEYFGHGFPFMNYGDVYKNQVTPLNVEGKVDSTDSERNQYSVLRGDVYFTRTSESKDDIGVSSTCLMSINECVFSGFVIRFRFYQESHLPEFSKYHFQTHWKKVFIESKMNIVTRSSLSQQVLGQVSVLIPPMNEQIHIIEHLDSKTKEIDDLVQLEQKKIDFLIEYRQSLISYVVTGKIKVTIQ